jgi:hypothetical protein
MHTGVNHIDKQDFLMAYHTAYRESMNLANIQSSFVATGLLPYDPERVLSKLTQFKTPTPPSSSHAAAPQSGPWTIKTPHDTTQLDLQAKAIKTACLPTPTNRALNQLVKGCQLAMNSAVLLAEENRQLRRENERQKKKRAQKKVYIATGGVLTIQEGIDLCQAAQKGSKGGAVNQEANAQPRAPRMCSLCRSLLHTARTCPAKQVSN